MTGQVCTAGLRESAFIVVFMAPRPRVATQSFWGILKLNNNASAFGSKPLQHSRSVRSTWRAQHLAEPLMDVVPPTDKIRTFPLIMPNPCCPLDSAFFEHPRLDIRTRPMHQVNRQSVDHTSAPNHRALFLPAVESRRDLRDVREYGLRDHGKQALLYTCLAIRQPRHSLDKPVVYRDRRPSDHQASVETEVFSDYPGGWR
mmetsp:Transcript_97666/g.276271  ORF Transcript_97666/g.276271 Transcript_97666/m.276271 type:complete len:201 (-) Transcript_97666:1014-1616(-)